MSTDASGNGRPADPGRLGLAWHDDGLRVTDADGTEAVLSLWMVRGLLFDSDVRRSAQRWFNEQTAPYRLPGGE